MFAGLLWFYWWFYSWGDMSFVKTLNGVWKTLNYVDFQSDGDIEFGNVLYNHSIGLFVRLFELTHTLEYYKVVVLMNGLASSILHPVLFLFAFYVSRKVNVALLVTLLHFSFAGNLILSINNEDIYPSYLFYVLHAVSFYLYLDRKKLAMGVLASFFASVSVLMHWTTGMITLTLFFPFNLYQFKDELPKKWKDMMAMALVPLATFALVAFCLDYPFLKIIYPAKGNGTLWVAGFELHSACLTFLNSINYYFLGDTIYLFSDINRWNLLIASVCLPLLTIPVVVVWRFFRSPLSKKDEAKTNMLKYLLVVFFGASVMNAYEQGNDMQFFIQPSFTFIYIMLLFQLVESRSRLLKRLYIPIVLVLVLGFDTFYVSMRRHYNTDQAWHQLEQLEENLVDSDHTLFIGDPFVTEMPLAMLKWGGIDKFHHIDFPDPLNSGIDMTDSDYLSWSRDSICQFVSQGYQLVVIQFINEPAEVLGGSFVGYDMTDKIRMIQEFLNDEFVVTKKVNPNGEGNRFFFLSPKSTACSH